MLVLSIKPDFSIPKKEYITIDGKTKVFVLSVNGENVRLGFEAPLEVSIVRSLANQKKDTTQ